MPGPRSMTAGVPGSTGRGLELIDHLRLEIEALYAEVAGHRQQKDMYEKKVRGIVLRTVHAVSQALYVQPYTLASLLALVRA